MHKLIRCSLTLFTAGWLLLAGTGCSPKAKADRALARAEGHFAAGRYDEAEIEYKNVIQLQPQNSAALGRLGVIYYEQSRVLVARPFLMKACELAPDNLALRLKLAQTELVFRDLKLARAKVLTILDREPGNGEAPILLVESAANAEEIAATRQRLQQLPPAIIGTAPVQLALGLIELRENKLDAAEATFKRVLALDPKSSEAHGAMAGILLLRKDLPGAREELRQAAELAPARSAKRIRYAQFLTQNGDLAAGRELLLKMSKEIPDYLPAWMSLAEMASMEKKYDEALALVGRVLSRDRTYPEALMLNARLRLAKGDFPKAVTELEQSLKLFPSSPQFSYQLGLAYVAAGDTRKAMDSLNQALTNYPDYVDAILLRASLNMKLGDSGTAIATLRPLVQKHPELIQPRLLLADAYRVRNSLNDSLAVYEGIEKDFPGNPRTPLLRGMVLLQQRKRPEAREAFELALQRAPDFQPAVEQLVTLDLQDKQYPAARQRVEGLLAKKPDSAELHILQARVFAAQRDFAQAEASLQKAIALQPAAPTPYFMLAGLSMASNQQQKALDNLGKILAANPKDTRALLMTGMLNEQLKHYDKALDAYEKLLAIDPKSGVALNNSAILYSERLNQLDKAEETARKARELFPLEPHIADTLGWILVKKGQYPWALTLLQESAEKLADSADVQFHLGLASYMMGNEETARVALEKALQSGQEFPGADDARKRLAVLGLAAGKAGPAERKILDAALAERPDDPVALVRLAAIHEQAGDLPKAVAAHQAILKANPANVQSMLNLVRIFALQKETAKAIEQAKALRKLAPDNTEAALALGRLSYQTRDFAYAYALLQEAARKQPDDAGVLRDLAKAAYSVGRVAEAETAMRQSLQLDSLSAGAGEARGFLELVALAGNPAQAAAAGARIAAILKATPNDVPALMVSAVISEQKPDAREAMAAYDKVLAQFPEFNPVKKRLAVLLAATDGDNKKAFDLALKARAAFPDDPELARAFGIILYRQGDFPRALAMLKEGAAKGGDDAELSFYQGMTQYRLKDAAAAKLSLRRALDLKLKAELAAEANKTLADLK